MRTALLLAVLALGASAAPAPKEASPGEKTPIQQYYDQALAYYSKGDYRRAVGKWTEVLKADSTQTTAKNMILEARKQIARLTVKRRERTFALIADGRYEAARLEVQALLDQDPGDPEIQDLQARLESVVKIAPRLKTDTKAARMAALGLKGWLVLPQDLKLAYDALRYAIELAPRDPRNHAFIELVLAQRPDLAEDEITPGLKLLEYKQRVAVHDIYDAKYHHAVQVLEEILALEPEDLLALKRLGSAYFSLGEKKRARAAWLKALKLAPNDATLKKFLAKTEGGAPAASPAPEQVPHAAQ